MHDILILLTKNLGKLLPYLYSNLQPPGSWSQYATPSVAQQADSEYFKGQTLTPDISKLAQ